MPFKYSYTSDRYFCVFSGIVTWDDLFTATGSLHGSENLDNLKEVLIMFSDSSKVIFSSKTPQELAYLDRTALNYNKSLRFAFVAKSPDAHNLALNYIKFSKEVGSKWNYEVFDNYDAAVFWLETEKKIER